MSEKHADDAIDVSSVRSSVCCLNSSEQHIVDQPYTR
jgi:hypothetical protein